MNENLEIRTNESSKLTFKDVMKKIGNVLKWIKEEFWTFPAYILAHPLKDSILLKLRKRAK